MNYIVSNNSKNSIVAATSIGKKLPLGTYNLCYDAMGNQYYLEQVADLKVPDKIYGNLELVNRAIKVYRNRDRNFGLFLYGLKGSGKSLAMRYLAIKLNQPVILINDNFRRTGGQEAIQFLSDPVLGDCTILIDEYEKKFDADDEDPLTLLDGPYSTHHFFILTANDLTINSNMRNRPGRIYYTVNYGGLEDDVIHDVINDLLINTSYKDELQILCEDIPNLSFDMLLSIINDVNLFNESPSKVLKWFGFSRDTQYATVYAKINGIKSSKPVVYNMTIKDDPRFRGCGEWCTIQLSNYSEVKNEYYFTMEDSKRVSKHLYIKSVDIIPDDIEDIDDDREEDKIAKKAELIKQGVVFLPDSYKVHVEFEIHLNSAPTINYIY